MFPMLPPRVVTPALGAVAGSTVGISTPEIIPAAGYVGAGVPPRFAPILNVPIEGAGAGATAGLGAAP